MSDFVHCDLVTEVPNHLRSFQKKLNEYPDEYFQTREVTDVSILGTKQMRSHTLFQIHCFNGHPLHRTDSNQWVSLKRYSDFVELDDSLSKLFIRNGMLELPKLPRKHPKALIDHAKAEFVEHRCLLLENYLQKLVEIDKVLESEQLLRFLNVEF